MIRVAVPCLAVLLASVSLAQEMPRPQKHPAEYSTLVNGKSPEDVLTFIERWTSERKNTVIETAKVTASLAAVLEFQEFSYDTALGKHLRGGYRAEIDLCLDRPRDIATVALFGDENQRAEFADQMFFVATIDNWFREHLKPNDRASLRFVEQLAWTRAAFTKDFAVKRAAIRPAANNTWRTVAYKAKYSVVADTLDPQTLQPQNGYEVMYVLELWEHYPSKHQPFPKFSTPSEHKIGAGRYVFYCREKRGNSYLEGPRRHLIITTDTPLDLHIPSRTP